MQTNTPSLHVVLGAGQIGTRVTDLHLEQGYRVRLVRRGSGVAPRERLEALSGDITDLGFVGQATRGAAVVYDCMNPAYHLWPEHLLLRGDCARSSSWAPRKKRSGRYGTSLRRQPRA